MDSHSTGPRTPEGKARSSMNAVTHGLTARTPLLPGEDADEFRRFVWEMIEDLGPAGPVQAELASRAAVLMWKRRRIGDAERLVIEELQNNYLRDEEDVEASEEEVEDTHEGEEPQEPPQDEHQPEEDQPEEDREEELAEDRAAGDFDAASPEGQARLRQYLLADEFATKPNQLDRLERYEHRISRQIDSTIRLLLRLQNRKDWREGRQGRADRAEPEPLPEPSPTATHRCAPSDAPQAPEPPPPAPAQNAQPPSVPESPETAPGRAWTGPPGGN